MTIVIAILTPLKENVIILFTGSFLLTSVLEYVTGYILEKVFHNKWWDYSDKPFNIKGYVCLKFSIYWGLACTFVMDIIHPIIYHTIRIIPFKIGCIIVVIIMIGFAVDITVTVMTILKFNRRIALMDDIAAQIHKISDEIGENIYENVSIAVEKSEEFQENHAEVISLLSEKKDEIIEKNIERKEEFEETRAEKRREMEELLSNYADLLKQKNTGAVRLMKAFPGMKSLRQNDTLQKYRKYFINKNKIKRAFRK
jgi:uncharacterized membrane protein